MANALGFTPVPTEDVVQVKANFPLILSSNISILFCRVTADSTDYTLGMGSNIDVVLV
jgi:hypothetical protein